MNDLSEEEEEKLLAAWHATEEAMVAYRHKTVVRRFQTYLVDALKPMAEAYYTPVEEEFVWDALDTEQRLSLFAIIGRARELDYSTAELNSVINRFLVTGNLPPALRPPEPEPELEPIEPIEGATEEEPEDAGDAEDAEEGKAEAASKAASSSRSTTGSNKRSRAARSISEWIGERLEADGFITKKKDFDDFETTFGLTRRTFIKHLRDNGLEYVNNKWVRQ